MSCHASTNPAPPPPCPAHLNNFLNAASQAHDLRHGSQIHAHLVVRNLRHPFLVNNLVNLYAKCGRLDRGLLLFAAIPAAFKTIVTWTTLIARFSKLRMPLRALAFFNDMRRSDLSPNKFTFSAVLPSCGESGAATHGRQMHSLICRHGLDDNVFVGSALVDMYAKSSDMESAERVFEEMSERNLVSWNSLMVGFLHNRIYDRVGAIFKGILREERFSPDQVSFSSVLSASANSGRLSFGRQLHGVALKHGLLPLSYVKNALLDLYGKCGAFREAFELFRTMGDKDLVTWNVMMMTCIHTDNFEEACNYFWVMRREGISPDVVSFSTVLHACASLAALVQGSLVHDQIIKCGFLANPCTSSSLITMYAKCGSLDDAYRVFQETEDQNVVCWTAMIAAYQQHGCTDHVIELFEDMLEKNITPGYITLVCVLSACSYTGRVEEGFAYFNSMTNIHCINPGHEHYACMVDLLGRAGRLNEAKRFIASMPITPGPSVWGALLGACRSYGDLEMGREVAEKLFEIEPDNPGNYVLLSNLYARRGQLKEANEVRKLMGANGVRKEAGCSWIDVRNTTFVFTVHDRSHSQTDEIYEILGKVEDLVKKKGYVPETEFAINDKEEHKERSLWYHSEKLALAFGLLTLPAGAPIRIKKNLRTCGDCHAVMKLASEIFCREIIVRDINRFHRFTNGSCSCLDYW